MGKAEHHGCWLPSGMGSLVFIVSEEAEGRELGSNILQFPGLRIAVWAWLHGNLPGDTGP